MAHLAPRPPAPNAAGLDFGPIQSAGDLPEVLAGLARAVVDAIGADACLISLVDDDRQVLRDVAASVVPPVRLNTVAEEYDLAEFPATRWVIETGSAVDVSVSDEGADRAERSFLAGLGFGRVLLSRFVAEGGVVGTVEAYRVADLPFRSDAAALVDTLASFAANAYARIELAEKLELHYTKTMEVLVSAVEARDPYTQEHTGRITDMAMTLGVAMQLPAEARRGVRLGAILHDVGKIGIPDAILRKPGPLTDDEWEIMRSHSQVGENMLAGVDFLEPALPIVRSHHERWDGRGYPDRLAGDDIPIGARIVAVCDSFDAMTSDRPYRAALPRARALDEIVACAGTQFDPLCAEILVEVVSEMGDRRLEERFVRYAS